MASIDRRPNGKWRARWREYPGGPQRARHFPRKIDAEQFLTAPEFAAITDFTDLRVRFTAIQAVEDALTLEGDFSGDLTLEGDFSGSLLLEGS